MDEHLAREVFQCNEVIFREGDPGDCAYLIEEGSVVVYKMDGNVEREIRRMGKGELFGEIALIDNQARTANVRAVEKTLLVPLRRSVVLELLDKTDPIIRNLLLVILERFRAAGSADQGALAGQLSQKMPDSLSSAASQNMTLSHEIAFALDREQFELHYQPICELHSGRVVGFEALIRWNHPREGMIPPLDFIGLAEQTGQIREIGMWTLERACRDWPQLRRHCDHDHPFVSVNLSPNQLVGTSFVDDVKSLIERTRMNPAELKLELTETTIIDTPDLAQALLRELTELGSSLALDDFGTGHSGLSALQLYPIVTMKIDRVFISSMLLSQASREIVLSSIKLAHSIGMNVVAEGVETEAIRYALLGLGCNFGQGWYFGRPAKLENIC